MKIHTYLGPMFLALTLALAGCGGGSNNADEPTEAEKMMQAAENRAKSAVTAATMAAEALTDSSDDAAVTNAEGLIVDAVRAFDALPEGSLDDYAKMLGSAMNIVDAHRSRLTAQSERDDAIEERDNATTALSDKQKEEDDEQTKRDNEAMEAMAKKLFNGLKQSGAAPANPTPADTANRALDGGTFSSLSSMAVMVDPDGAGAAATVTVNKSSTAVPDLNGWSGADYVQTRSGTTDHVVLYHNQGEESESFSEKHSAIIDANDGDDLGTYQIPNADLITESSQGFIAAGDFSMSGQKDHTDEDDEKVEVSGSFDGVPGTYSCTQGSGTACSSTVTSGGGILLGGGWTFSRFSLNAMTQTKDSNYLVYGWWSRESSAGVDVATFAASKGTVQFGDTGANGINGTATYKGGAAGKYAVYNPLGDNSSAGAFTANAEFTADFTNDSISGELTGFMSGGEEKDWEVSLMVGDNNDDSSDGVANITDSGIVNGGSPSTVWTMDGMSDDPRGTWAGHFHGSNSATAVSTTATPPAVTGTFTAMYEVGGLEIGQMAGAFGADTD
ncbi:MAG: hypothetical protein OXI71_14135 [Gemmatimonadota bacterium]|nr:hypothetical protein [Gemmatimonadota bacterium]